MGKFIDLTGQKFNRLTVLEYLGKTDKGKRKYKCKCDCGKEIIVFDYNLKNGHTKSCGCYKIERDKEYHTKHGQRNTRLYNVWSKIICRCYFSSESKYGNYGGRGITMCKEWREDFCNFYKWALESGYKEEILPNGKNKWTIDRIDTNGNYEPSNCRWVTIQQQQNNRNTNIYCEINGEKLTLAETARKYNVDYRRFWARLKSGWSVEDAIQGKNTRKRKSNRD